jgi:hypothetical protein
MASHTLHVVQAFEERDSGIVPAEPTACPSDLAAGLRELGHQISHGVVGELLRSLGYSLQANRKTREGGNHPDRDAQFSYFNISAIEVSSFAQ